LGSRLATSAGGVPAGRGADIIIIIDDPLKPRRRCRRSGGRRRRSGTTTFSTAGSNNSPPFASAHRISQVGTFERASLLCNIEVTMKNLKELLVNYSCVGAIIVICCC
jgi:hypothetical protein